MDLHCSDRARDPFPSVHVAQHALDLPCVARGEHRHRRSGAAQADADHIRMPQREQPAQPRHQGLAVGLVRAVLRAPRACRRRRPVCSALNSSATCCMLKIVSPSGSRFGSARRDTEVAQLDVRRCHDDAPARRPRPLRYGDAAVGALAAARHAAEDRRRGIVGVSFDLRRRVEDFVPGRACRRPARAAGCRRSSPRRCCRVRREAGSSLRTSMSSEGRPRRPDGNASKPC